MLSASRKAPGRRASQGKLASCQSNEAGKHKAGALSHPSNRCLKVVLQDSSRYELILVLS